jgi:hypothetical protein
MKVATSISVSASARLAARAASILDEPEQDGEPGRQHAEHPRGAVAVVDVAAVRRVSPHQQHRRDRHSGHSDDDEQRPDQVHPQPCRLDGRRITIDTSRSAVVTRSR